MPTSKTKTQPKTLPAGWRGFSMNLAGLRITTRTPQNLDLLTTELAQTARKVRQQKNVPTHLKIVSAAHKILQRSARVLIAADLIVLLLTAVLLEVANHFIFGQGGFSAIFSNFSLRQLGLFMMLGMGAMVWLDLQGHYRNRPPFWTVAGNLILVVAACFFFTGFLEFALKSDFSRLWTGLSWTVFGTASLGARLIVQRLMQAQGTWQIPTILIGQAQLAAATQQSLRSEPGLGYEVRAVVPTSVLADLTSTSAWEEFLAAHEVSYVLLAIEGRAYEAFQPALSAAARAHVPYAVVPPWVDLPSSTRHAHQFFGQDLMLLHNVSSLAQPLPRFFKRSVDVLGAACSLVLLSPVMLAVAALIKLDGGKVFFQQPRVGLHGASFNCLKFRSMRVDAEAALQDYLSKNELAAAEWRKYQKLRDDPRITKIGKFIRRSNLDELPQLINVLRGDMSLIGPRPMMLDQAKLYEDDLAYYTAVRPGLTGPWQVSGRNLVSFAERIRLEAWYVRNWSVWLDMVILFKTIPVLLRGDQTS